jgi:two-component system sensor histidine kinase MtrB
MRTRLAIAFIVVAMAAVLATVAVIEFAIPNWGQLYKPTLLPHWLASVVYLEGPPMTMRHPRAFALILFWLSAAALLLAVVAGMAAAASRRVLLPVRLASAAQRMSDGDLAVRIEAESRGRDELAQLVTTFNAMACALQDKVGELARTEARARQFAGDVSHELRTPLTAMTAVADMLGDQPGVTGDGAVAADLVSQEIRHLNRLVDDLIEVSRFDAGTAQLVIDDTDIAVAADRCLRVRNWTSVDIDVPPGLTVPLDRRRFDVVLANLVGNALRHGSAPVSLRASIEPDEKGGKELVVEVLDHGPGLAPGAVARVFDRFYKADSARARSGGSGLGLAIAQENARLHGGRIDAANHPRGGAVFTVRLPAH